MARKRSALGYNSEDHNSRALDAYTHFMNAKDAFDKSMEKGDCKKALRDYRYMAMEEASASENFYAATEGDELSKENYRRMVAMDTAAREADESFEFVCIVGAAFSGVKRRRRR